MKGAINCSTLYILSQSYPTKSSLKGRAVKKSGRKCDMGEKGRRPLWAIPINVDFDRNCF